MALVEADGKVDYEKDDEARMEALRLFTVGALPLAVRAASLLNVPEILLEAGRDKALSVEDIAKLVPVPPGAPVADAANLERILRILASHDVVKEFTAKKPGKSETIERRYGASAVLKYMRDVDGSMGPWFGMLPFFFQPHKYLHSTVVDKNSVPFVLENGAHFWDFMSKSPEWSRTFQRCMTSHTTLFLPMLLDQYDGFRSVNTLLDVGGGTGRTVASIVSKYPHIRGINFDMPNVTSVAPQWPGVEHVGGSFFTDALPDCDAAFMKWILHGCDHETCVKLLKQIGNAMPEHGKIINVDAVLPESLDSTPRTYVNLGFDMLMMAVSDGGKERTLADFSRIGAEAGFSRVEVALTIDNLSVLEFYKK